MRKAFRNFLIATLACTGFAQADDFLGPLTWRDSTWDYRTEDPEYIKSEVSVPKLAATLGVGASAYAAAYVFVFAKGWWDEDNQGFHFENDFDYAKNIDKLGHFSAGVLIGDVFYEGYRWSGLSEFKSYLFAGLTAMSTHIAIDIKDGFAPEWGFSIFDVLAGSIGGFLPMAERYIPVFKYIDLKWSYWVNSKVYYENTDTGIFTDDYPNHTYWCSFKINRMLPASVRDYYPDWLAVAAGISVDDVIFHKGLGKHPKGGSYEIYIALDYDLEALRPQSRWARTLVRYLNYIKLPAPTIQVYPEFHVHWLYPIKF
ncbi:MAG: DUF2279 domain-containing protein [Fibrobacter sp.]|nr:DUF2279 domain-containing protein [Fibrobacter sp.]